MSDALETLDHIRDMVELMATEEQLQDMQWYFLHLEDYIADVEYAYPPIIEMSIDGNILHSCHECDYQIRAADVKKIKFCSMCGHKIKWSGR